MPRIARFTIASIAELTRQLRFAPAETRAKQMDAAELLASEIDPDQLYPEDFVIFRITGYRPQRMENPAVLVGDALLGDLVNFIQHLSDELQLPAGYRSRQAVPLEEVAQRLNVSLKTVQRYRRRGLICHYVQFSANDKRLSCFEDALARFINGHKETVKQASAFSRIDNSVAEKIIGEARDMRHMRKLSLNVVARKLATKHNRAHETVRLMLRKHDRSSDDPIFAERGPLTERDSRLLHRAWAWGVPVAVMADRFGRTTTTIHRAINRRRGQLLCNLNLSYVKLPTFSRDDAAQVILSVPAVREGLDRTLPNDDALAFIDAAHEYHEAPETEVGLLAAYNFLKRRAVAGMHRFDDWPRTSDLDRVETDLRWASRLKRRLLCIGVKTALSRVEQNLHRPLREQPADRVIAAIRTAVQIVGSVIETLDPSKDQQLARVTAYSTDRALARDDRLLEKPGRAAARHDAQIAVVDLFRAVAPWETFLNSRERLKTHLATLDAPAQELLALRYGWTGCAPCTIAELAQRTGARPATIARRLTAIERQLLAAMHSEKNSPAER